jgi:hypothetical protein
MKLYLLVPLALLAVSHMSFGVLHPELINPKIDRCANSNSNGDCSVNVFYSAEGTRLVDDVPVVPPNPKGGTRIFAIGVHCQKGSMLTGVPFSGCMYDKGPSHSPGVTNCELKSVDSWELTSTSTCSLRNSTCGQHTGAGPGGECIVFAQDISSTALRTIYGDVTAESVANAGNRFCIKPSPPDQTCTIDLPSEIDHGVINTNAESVVTINGWAECGMWAGIDFVGGSKLELAPGVTTVLTHSLYFTGSLKITSTLTAVNGAPGAHAASVVVRVSPN